jgi:hypothetical protein
MKCQFAVAVCLFACSIPNTPQEPSTHPGSRPEGIPRSAAFERQIDGMRQYRDSRFDFSFWYPAAWTVKPQDRISNPTNSGYFRGGRIVQRLWIKNPSANDQDSVDSVEIEVIQVPSGRLTELGHSMTASPVGEDTTFSYDSRPESGAGTTVGGLGFSYGAGRHLGEIIVWLDRTHLLSATTTDAGGNEYHWYLAKTVVGRETDAGKRGIALANSDAIHMEALSMKVIGQPVGECWYKDNDHVYYRGSNAYGNSLSVIPTASAKSFVLLSARSPGNDFATDGVRIFRCFDGTVAIPGADPKTFEVQNVNSARDLYHTFKWDGGTLTVGKPLRGNQ